MPPRHDVIRKVRKLRALANDPNASQGERDNAARVARALMDANGLIEMDLDLDHDQGGAGGAAGGQATAEDLDRMTAEALDHLMAEGERVIDRVRVRAFDLVFDALDGALTKKRKKPR